jgi:heat-inducible transcriptional repressor
MNRIEESPETLNPRRKTVLFTTIAEYVSTGRPVSSNSLQENHQLELSPATIRRELRILSEQGYLIQPHTSAGRIPTDRAFRLFADTLKGNVRQLDSTMHKKLMTGIGQLLPGGRKSWQEVVRLISDLSYQTALIVTPALNEAVLKQLRFIPSGPGSLLSVIITQEGLVHNAFVKSPGAFSELDLEKMHTYLGSLIEGRTLNDIRSLLRKELEDARIRHDKLREQATLIGTEAIRSTVESNSELVVDGRSHLLTQPDLKDGLEEIICVLEEKGRILELLDRAADTDSGPVVIIGEDGGEDFHGCAMITAPFGKTGGEGQIGVIGSSRMDYSAVMPLIALAAQFLSTKLIGEDD